MPTNRTLALLAVAAALPLAAWAQAPGQAPANPNPSPAAAPDAPPPETEASKALDQAIEQVRAIETVAAGIVMEARMLGQSFRVVGEYLKAPEYRMKLRLDVEGLGNVDGLAQQVSDGTTLWDFSQVLDAGTLRKITLAPVLEILNRPDADPEIRKSFFVQVGLGGPEALLDGLKRSVAFDQKRADSLDGHEVWVLGGRWTDASARGLPGAAPAGPGAGAATMLPPYVPSYVEVWLDQKDGWPYKVVFEGSTPAPSLRDARMLGADGRPIGRRTANGKEKPTSMVLLYNRLQREVKPADFLFQPPPGVEAVDDTERFVAGMEAQAAQAAAQKRGDAASGTGELLDESLTAPRPDAGAPPSPPGAAPSPETFRSSAPPR